MGPASQGEGAALLIGGYRAPEQNGQLLHTLGRIGEALFATTTDWRIRRLSPLAGDRDTPDRAGLKRHLTQLAEQEADVILVAIAGLIATADGPALVASAEYEDYPQDATLALGWIRDCLRGCRAPRALIVASVAPVDGAADERSAQRWLDALGTGRPGQVVAIDPSGPRGAALAALLAGLGGAALDTGTGTTTMRSISDYLVRAVPGIAIQTSDQAATLASSPPLAGPWDARLTLRAEGQVRDASDLVGSVLPGRFRIDRKLARGSFGTVYLARQLAVDRDVAVKVLEGDLDPGSDVARLFVHEIQSVGRIDHPNVVRIYQADMTAGGRLFFAMELLAGLDLQQIVERDGAMPRDRAVGLIRQLLAGLGAAHDAGLVHADVKPANAFVVPGKDERAVLLDFGLSRLHHPDEAAASAGGTPAYMAPEQLRDGRVDSRSDLFAVALILVRLLTGWRRRSAEELVPPLGGIDDPTLRRVLARALAIAPDERFQTAGELSEALGGAAAASTVAAVRAPFRHLAPFTESDRDGLHGRSQEIAALVGTVLYRRAVIYTAPSGTGKTSLLRAGLISRLDVLGIEAAYMACRASSSAALAAALSPGAVGIADAAAARVKRQGSKLVVIVDQIEEALVAGDPVLDELARLGRLPGDAEVSLVLAVREDFLASLLAHDGFNGMPVVRLGPLTRDAARQAIVSPLLERRIAITDELLAHLLDDLNTAGLAIAPEMRWSQPEAIYPPHLQLACSVLYEALGPGEATLSIEHYRRLGGLEAIVGEYLERVLESELPPSSTAAARAILLALVNPNQTRAFCTEAELADTVCGRHGGPMVAEVLEALRSRGLIVRLRSATGELGWELVHDSLVPRVLAWLDRRDLARRRAVELVRHHLRRSRPDRPSLLSTDELHELRDHAGAVDELDAEWSRRASGPFGPARLVQLSRRARRLRIAAVAGLIGIATAIASVLGYRWFDERERRHQQELMANDVGVSWLELRPFDWNPMTQTATPVAVAELPALDWQLYDPPGDNDVEQAHSPHQLTVVRTPGQWGVPMIKAWLVQARGGSAVMVVSGRGRNGKDCAPSVIPLRRLPGFASRSDVQTIAVHVPTCQATHAGMIEIPAGDFIDGGRGDPPVVFNDHVSEDTIDEAAIVHLPRFAIDRTEVTNAAYRMFTSRSNATSMAMPRYPSSEALQHAGGDAYPVTDIERTEARAYCRFLGKDLPSSPQWRKALRGGTTLDGQENPMPRRNLPWGSPRTPIPARVAAPDVGPAEVGTSPGDVSPYGVLDLAGNVQEWTSSNDKEGGLVTRGCTWTECSSPEELLRYMAIPNPRSRRFHNFTIGFRCAL